MTFKPPAFVGSKAPNPHACTAEYDDHACGREALYVAVFKDNRAAVLCRDHGCIVLEDHLPYVRVMCTLDAEGTGKAQLNELSRDIIAGRVTNLGLGYIKAKRALAGLT